MTDYCKISQDSPLHKSYHDKEYGFPVSSDEVLFERLSLEIFQAGLSWGLILKKRSFIKSAFSHFNINSVSKYNTENVEDLLNNEGIIRNRLKILSIIENAKRLKRLCQIHGSFVNWLDFKHPLENKKWVKIFKNTFKFTGNEITREFLMSTGYLPGAHTTNCKVFRKIISLNPPWVKALNSITEKN